jgi:hypothetical protein
MRAFVARRGDLSKSAVLLRIVWNYHSHDVEIGVPRRHGAFLAWPREPDRSVKEAW